MNEEARIQANSLEDVVAAVTRLSDVDGQAGRLLLAGTPVEELAGSASFEAVVYRLWHGHDATPAQLADTTHALGVAREAAFERLGDLGNALSLADPMDALRAAVAHLSLPEREDASAEQRFQAALVVVAAVAVFAASWSQPGAAWRPDRNASHAHDYLRLVQRVEPSPAAVAALDAYLVAVVDHGMNASTFAARVVASTASDAVSAVVAALGALKGKLHGGAPGPVLDMLDAIGAEADAAAARRWLEAELARGARIMGMGHRVYRVRDPRAFVLERALVQLEASRPEGKVAARLRLARLVEGEAESLLAVRHAHRPLRANVEFYTAVLLEAIGLARARFTPTFAVSRVAGWCAHVAEQRAVGKLIRPQSLYVKALPSKPADHAQRGRSGV